MKPHFGSEVKLLSSYLPVRSEMMLLSIYEIIHIWTACVVWTLLPSSCLNWKTHCDDHSSLSSTTAIQSNMIILEMPNIRRYDTEIHTEARKKEKRKLKRKTASNESTVNNWRKHIKTKTFRSLCTYDLFFSDRTAFTTRSRIYLYSQWKHGLRDLSENNILLILFHCIHT